MELEAEGAPIAVTLVKPSSIATPFAEHAENYMNEEPNLPPPLYDPQVVARSILHCAEQPRRDIYVGAGGKMIAALGQYAPRLADKVMEATVIRQQKSGRPEHRQHFALQEPASDRRETIHYPNHVAKSSIYTESSLHPVLTTALVVGSRWVLRHSSSSGGRPRHGDCRRQS